MAFVAGTSRISAPRVPLSPSSAGERRSRVSDATAPGQAVAGVCGALLACWRCGVQRRRWRASTRRVLDVSKALPPSPVRLNEDQPGSGWQLGQRTFCRELGQLILALRNAQLTPLADAIQGAAGLKEIPKPPELPGLVAHFKLDIDQVVARETQRGVPDSSPVVKAIFFVLCWSLDRLYEGRPIQKFWVLETVARLPYFSYITVLHLYESLGWWRSPEIRHIHSAEEDNELHHLLIMEALGGDTSWFDRFAAQHAALVYYWIITGLFILSPENAYNFSHLVEEHAYVTYQVFAEENAQVLRQVPPPPIAVKYYVEGDLYNFDKFQTRHREEPRRPPCDNLLDVFENIRDDEYEHIVTMKACQEWWAGCGPSPIPRTARTHNLTKDREAWKQWADDMNRLSE